MTSFKKTCHCSIALLYNPCLNMLNMSTELFNFKEEIFLCVMSLVQSMFTEPVGRLLLQDEHNCIVGMMNKELWVVLLWQPVLICEPGILGNHVWTAEHLQRPSSLHHLEKNRQISY